MAMSTFGTATSIGIMPVVIGASPTNNYIPQSPPVGSKSPTFEIVLGPSGGNATVQILGSVGGAGWSPVCVLSATGVLGADSSTVNFQVGYNAYQANVTAMSGGSTAVTVNVGW